MASFYDTYTGIRQPNISYICIYSRLPKFNSSVRAYPTRPREFFPDYVIRAHTSEEGAQIITVFTRGPECTIFNNTHTSAQA